MFRRYFFSPFTSSFFWSAASFPHQPYLGLWWLETAILFSAISTTNETLPEISSISFFREHCIDHRPCQQGDWLEGLKSIFSSNIPSLSADICINIDSETFVSSLLSLANSITVNHPLICTGPLLKIVFNNENRNHLETYLGGKVLNI